MPVWSKAVTLEKDISNREILSSHCVNLPWSLDAVRVIIYDEMRKMPIEGWRSEFL